MIRKPLFNGGLFREGMRQLRMPGIVMLVLMSVFEMFPLITILLTRDHWDLSYATADVAFTAVHASLYIIPFIAPLVLTLTAFRFQNSRRDSDFYHSLPLTKLGMSISFLTAIALWCAIITVGSSLAIYLLAMMLDPTVLSIGNVLLSVGGSLAASMLAMSIAFFAATLSGQTLTTIAVTFLFLVGPRMMLSFLANTVADSSHVMPWTSDILGKYYEGLLYGQYDSLSAWIATIIITLIVLALGMWLANRRPSETAGHSAVSPKVQAFFRIVFAFVCSLPAILMIYDNNYLNYTAIGFVYLFVVAAYFLFELFTTKKARNLLKAIPGLAVVAALNVLCILAMNGLNTYIWSVQPDADQIKSISVSGFIDCNVFTEDNSVSVFPPKTYEQMPNDALFWRYEDIWEDGDYDQIELTSRAVREAVSDALKTSVAYAKNDTIYPSASNGALYRIEVAIHTESGTHKRRIWLTQEQFDTIILAVHAEKSIPAPLPGGAA